MVSTNDIKTIAPEARNCYFEDEKDLVFYEKYTYINCRLECAILEAEKMQECIPWHLPRVNYSNSDKIIETSTVISVNMPTPHFYRKYAQPFSEGSFLKILW